MASNQLGVSREIPGTLIPLNGAQNLRPGHFDLRIGNRCSHRSIVKVDWRGEATSRSLSVPHFPNPLRECSLERLNHAKIEGDPAGPEHRGSSL